MAVNHGVLQASFVQVLDGKVYSNQIHFAQAPSDLAPVNLLSYAEQHGEKIMELWTTNMAPLTADLLQVTELQLTYFGLTEWLPTIPPAPVGTPQKLFFHADEQYVYTTGLPANGLVENDYLPAFNSYRARKLTGTPGRRWRGHNSFTGVPEANTIGNEITTGDWTVWQTNAPLLLGSSYTVNDDLFTFVMQPVVLSLTSARAAGMAGIEAAVYSRFINSVIPNRLVGTMRRRKKKTL